MPRLALQEAKVLLDERLVDDRLRLRTGPADAFRRQPGSLQRRRKDMGEANVLGVEVLGETGDLEDAMVCQSRVGYAGAGSQKSPRLAKQSEQGWEW